MGYLFVHTPKIRTGRVFQFREGWSALLER
jgi:hypothetical protein